MRKVALTTVDNPYHPEDQFQEWYQFDEAHGYGTSEYIARLANTTDDMSTEEYWRKIEEAIDSIIEYCHLFRKENIYKKLEWET